MKKQKRAVTALVGIDTVRDAFKNAARQLRLAKVTVETNYCLKFDKGSKENLNAMIKEVDGLIKVIDQAAEDADKEAIRHIKENV